MDIEWSPNTSTVFASVCKDGRLELWDLEKNNMLDPVAFIKPKDGEIFPEKTMVKFAEDAPVIITGDVAGDVNVYRLHSIFKIYYYVIIINYFRKKRKHFHFIIIIFRYPLILPLLIQVTKITIRKFRRLS